MNKKSGVIITLANIWIFLNSLTLWDISLFH